MWRWSGFSGAIRRNVSIPVGPSAANCGGGGGGGESMLRWERDDEVKGRSVRKEGEDEDRDAKRRACMK